jgi:hypothetical protein
MFGPISELVALVVAALLLVFASRKWITVVRAELPPWRNALCCVSLFLLSLTLCSGALEFILPMVRQGSSEAIVFGVIELFSPLCLIAVVAAIALKRNSRIQAILAGLLMFTALPIGYV